jgi:hypothetical protein
LLTSYEIQPKTNHRLHVIKFHIKLKGKWGMPIIPVLKEAEAEGLRVQGQPGIYS